MVISDLFQNAFKKADNKILLVNDLNNFIPPTDDGDFLIKINSTLSANPLGYRGNMPRSNIWDIGYNYVNTRNWNDIIQPTNLTLEEILISRSQKVLQTSQPIKVFWSGGIDSTLFLLFILLNKQSHNNLEIYHTCDSIRENPTFYDFIKKFNVPTVYWSDQWEVNFQSDDIIMTGGAGDQLTASIDESFYSNYSDWLHRSYIDFLSFKGWHDDNIEAVKQKISLLRLEINTVLEFRWWFYFDIRYNYFVNVDYQMNLENLTANSVISFFDDQLFDNWSFSNKNSYIENGAPYRTYKQEFKDLIYKYWNDDNYRKNMTKISSYHAQKWVSIKMMHNNQHHMCLYQDKNNIRKIFKPKYYPFVSKKALIEEFLLIS